MLFGASPVLGTDTVPALIPWVTAMRHAPSTLHLSHAFHSPPPPGAIEWEELPSLAQRVRQPCAGAASVPWDATRPAGLESIPASLPFRELKGVSIREVNEPDVFRHFFGR
ncbi:MAG: hypothetical protein M3Z15_04385 [Pseudomonadota bacterium]|nr:hypothetical protein [Pseudomonadota bacterium]